MRLIISITFLFLSLALILYPGVVHSQTLKYFPVIDVHIHANDSKGHVPNLKAAKNLDVVSPSTYAEFEQQFFNELKKNRVVLALVSAPLNNIGLWKDPLHTRFYYTLFVNNPADYKPYLDSISKLSQNRVLSGIGELGAEYAGKSPSDTVYEDLYLIAERFDLPIGIHTGGGPSEVSLTSAPNFRFEYGNPYLLQDLLIRHPKLRVFMMHAGLPNYGRETLAMMHMFPNLYVDIGIMCWIGTYEKISLEAFLKDAMNAGFGDRIMLGSDGWYWPESISRSVEFIKNAKFLTVKQKKDILYFNAAKFLRLSPEQIKNNLLGQ